MKNLWELFRDHGFFNHEDFSAVSEIIGTPRRDLSDFIHGRLKVSRLELLHISWIDRLSELSDIPRRTLIEGFRQERWGGWVYIIEWNNEYKIGRTQSLMDRFADFRYRYKGFTVIRTIETNEAAKLENMLHTRYKIFKVHGEWYLLPEEQIHILQSVKRYSFKPLER